MDTYIDKRGPYVLEMTCNADARNKRPTSMAAYWAESLMVSPNGKFAYAESLVPSSWQYRLLYFPHRGEGEPRPQP